MSKEDICLFLLCSTLCFSKNGRNTVTTINSINFSNEFLIKLLCIVSFFNFQIFNFDILLITFRNNL